MNFRVIAGQLARLHSLNLLQILQRLRGHSRTLAPRRGVLPGGDAGIDNLTRTGGDLDPSSDPRTTLAAAPRPDRAGQQASANDRGGPLPTLSLSLVARGFCRAL